MWLMRLLGLEGRPDSPPPPEAMDVRDEMARDDPEYPRARAALHEAKEISAIKQAWDQIDRRRALRKLDILTEAETGHWTRTDAPHD